MDIRVDRSAVGNPPVVRLPAEVDLENAEQVLDDLLTVLPAADRLLVVDMSGTTFCSARGLRCLALVAERAGRAGTKVVVVQPRARQAWYLRLAVAPDDLPVFESVEAALADSAAREGGPTPA